MQREEILDIIRIGGYLFGAVLYTVIFYIFLTCILKNETQIIVNINKFDEAWWEILLLPSFGFLIFGGLFLEFKKWWNEYN